MRIITRKLYKAFRELDRFEEPRAKAFVRVASSGWRARGFRYGVMALVGLLMGVGTIVFVVWLANLPVGTRSFRDILQGIALTLGITLPFLAVMLTRDLLIRWRIRRLIRKRGTCQLCNYSLLGIPVGPDLIVTCPECGHKIKADPAMNELATTTDGLQTYTPSGQVDFPASMSGRKQPHKRAVKWPVATPGGPQTYSPRRDTDSPAVIAARKRRQIFILKWILGPLACLLVLAGITVGIWSYRIATMARQARGSRNFSSLATALVDSAHPPNALAVPNQWADLVQILESFDSACRTFSNEEINKLQITTGSKNTHVYIDFEQLYLPQSKRPDPDTNVESDRPEWTAKRREFTELLIKELAENGVLDGFNSIQSIQHATRPIADIKNRNPYMLELPELKLAEKLARLNAARMEMALSSGNMPEYLAALDQTLATARLLDRQVSFYDRRVATRIEALMLDLVRSHTHRYPDEAVRTAVTGTLHNRARTIPVAHAIEGFRLMSRDFAGWFFSDPSRVVDVSLNGKSSEFFRLWITNRSIDRVGSYAENLSAADRQAEAHTAASTLPRWQRDIQPTARLKTIYDVFNSPGLSFLDYEDQALATSRATLVILALENYLARTGAYPATLAELGPTNPTLDTTDPFTGKPFGYRLTPGSADGRGYLLWSAGNDGIDNGGISSVGIVSVSGNSQPYAGLNWETVNTDVIFNDPPTPATPTPTRPSPAPPGSN